MNRAVFWKTFRDYRLLVTILILAIVLFELLAVRMLLEGVRDLGMVRIWLDRPLLKTLVRLVFGGDLVGDLTATTLSTVALAHPLLWALCWILVVTIPTGVLSGEIGRGTADLLLTLPLSRGRIYLSTSAVWIAAVVPASFAPLLGLWLGQQVFPLPERLEFGRLWQVSVNFCALNWCIASVAMCVSSLVRGVGRRSGASWPRCACPTSSTCWCRLGRSCGRSPAWVFCTTSGRWASCATGRCRGTTWGFC